MNNQEMAYSLVVATSGRPEFVRSMLESMLLQSEKPVEVIVVDVSYDKETDYIYKQFESQFKVKYISAKIPSAAQQRNQGLEYVTTEYVAFCDDDVVLEADCMKLLMDVFRKPGSETVGGVAARIKGFGHPKPGWPMWLYYRLQAGYGDSDYGARLFGPAINLLPYYEGTSDDLIRADWLNLGATIYRTELVRREKFPPFVGYSFLEDVHLSARIARTHRLYFHAQALYQHLNAPSLFKSDRFQMARMALQNRCIVAREVMGLSGWSWLWKSLLHRCFVSLALCRRQFKITREEIVGTWKC